MTNQGKKRQQVEDDSKSQTKMNQFQFLSSCNAVIQTWGMQFQINNVREFAN